jgi:hypothetical protein
VVVIRNDLRGRLGDRAVLLDADAQPMVSTGRIDDDGERG